MNVWILIAASRGLGHLGSMPDPIADRIEPMLSRFSPLLAGVVIAVEASGVAVLAHPIAGVAALIAIVGMHAAILAATACAVRLRREVTLYARGRRDLVVEHGTLRRELPRPAAHEQPETSHAAA